MNSFGEAIRILSDMSDTYPADIKAHKAYIGCRMNKPEWINKKEFPRIYDRAVYLDKSIAINVENRISRLCAEARIGKINLQELMKNCEHMKGRSPSLDALLKEAEIRANRANDIIKNKFDVLSKKTYLKAVESYFSHHCGIYEGYWFTYILKDMAYTVKSYYDDVQHSYCTLKEKYSDGFIMNCLKKTEYDCAERLCPECRKGKVKRYSSNCSVCGKYISYKP